MVVQPLISALRRQRQADYCDLKADLIYMVSKSRPGLRSETLSEKQTNAKTKTPKTTSDLLFLNFPWSIGQRSFLAWLWEQKFTFNFVGLPWNSEDINCIICWYLW